MANEPLNDQPRLLKSSSEMDELRSITNSALSPVTKITVGDKYFFSRTLSDGEFQLTDSRSAKILDNTFISMQYIGSLEDAEKQCNVKLAATF